MTTIRENHELSPVPEATDLSHVCTLQNRAIVFIDPSVDDYSSLIAGVLPGVEVVLLDSMRDGVKQITERLRSCPDFASIHIVSHGSPGCLYLGNSQLSLETLDGYASDLQTWLSPSLLLYGCKVAAGDAGAEFIEKLHHLTGAEIAASAKLTGSSTLGGDWNLEVTTSKINVSLIFLETVKAKYVSVLANVDLSGKILWTDSEGKTHPVRQSTVKIQDRDTGFDDHVKTVRTDINGFYSAIFNNNDGFLQGRRDIYLKVSANSPFHFVQDPEPIFDRTWVFDSGVRENIPNEKQELNLTIPNDTTIGYAFSVSDAVYTAGKAAQIIRGLIPRTPAQSFRSVTEVNFPVKGDTSFFQEGGFFDGTDINITSSYRWSWDVIHHEYGHFLANLDSLDKSPGGSHSFGVSNIPARGKLNGVRLAWGEGLATYLGTAIQTIAKAADFLPDVSDVGDTWYNSTDADNPDRSFSVSLETNTGSGNAGEGDEASVMRILWDIADDVQDWFSSGLRDVISLGHQALYNILNNQIPNLDRLDNVWDYFFNTSDDETRTQYGAIFEEYSVSPSPFGSWIGQTFRPGEAIPTFEWSPGNNNANDEFQVIIFNDDFSSRELVVDNINNATQWTPTQDQWDSILNTPGDYHFVIAGSDTDVFTTGSYWSGAYSFFVDKALPTSGNDTLMGSPGDDLIDALAGDDIVDGFGGNDQLNGGDGNDELFGGADNDTLEGGDGKDTLDGGEGIDTANYANVPQRSDDDLFEGIRVDLSQGKALDGYGNIEDLVNIENVIGTPRDDDFIGDDRDNYFYGGGGRDVFRGNAGNDTLDGGEGSDDLVDYLTSPSRVEINLESGFASDGFGNTDRLYGIEQVAGSSFRDLIIANSGSTYINGQSGADTLIGNGGDDTIEGTLGDDLIRGNGGNDELQGGPDNDYINGGNDNDTLLGGAGNDSLYGEAGDDSISGGEGDDFILGWRGNDVISGGAGHDTFVLRETHGTDTILDFNLEDDLIGLKGGLAVTDLSVTPNNGNTQIKFGTEVLAILEDVTVAKSDINFVSI
jgi:Ca2+-binding RTX toxin-like protein